MKTRTIAAAVVVTAAVTVTVLLLRSDDSRARGPQPTATTATTATTERPAAADVPATEESPSASTDRPPSAAVRLARKLRARQLAGGSTPDSSAAPLFFPREQRHLDAVEELTRALTDAGFDAGERRFVLQVFDDGCAEGQAVWMMHNEQLDDLVRARGLEGAVAELADLESALHGDLQSGVDAVGGEVIRRLGERFEKLRLIPLADHLGDGFQATCPEVPEGEAWCEQVGCD